MNRRLWISLSVIALIMVSTYLGFRFYPQLRHYSPELSTQIAEPTNTAVTQNGNVTFGLPKGSVAYPNPIQVLLKPSYIVGYDNIRLNPAWVAYRIIPTLEKLQSPPSRILMPDAQALNSISPSTYTDAEYTPHLLANPTVVGSHLDPKSNDLYSLYTTINAIPVKSDLGPWTTLDKTISENWGQRFISVWVITGPIYTQNTPEVLSHITPVQIPDALFYTILVMRQGHPHVAAFIFPTNAPATADPSAYYVSIARVENATNLIFFPELNDRIQTYLKHLTTSPGTPLSQLFSLTP